MAAPHWTVTHSEFEALVEDAVSSLPGRFRKLLDNVVIVVEEEPDREDLAAHGIEEEGELLGIFRGVPLTRRGFEAPLMPTQIAIFRRPILRVCDSREEAM